MTWDRNKAATPYPENINYNILNLYTTTIIALIVFAIDAIA